MIITSSLAWHHLPKTAGTTTESLFLASGVNLLWNDPQSNPIKHLPPLEHPHASDLPLVDQHCVLNFRRLPHWLLSNYQHKRTKMGLLLDASPMQNGFFWRHQMQEWLPADWWLKRLSVDKSWTFLRVEYLKRDFIECLSTYEAISPLSYLRMHLVPSLNRNRYDHSLQSWFSNKDLKKIYHVNPLWSAFELATYGSLLCSS